MSRQTSERGYYVRQQAREVTGLRPTAAASTRWVQNNLNHLQDESLQTVANVTASNGSNYTRTVSVAGEYALLDNVSPFPVMLHRQDDGSSSRLVCSLRGYCDTVGKTATFIVMLRPLFLGALPFSPITGVATSATIAFASITAAESIATVYVEQLSAAWALTDPQPIGLNAAGAPTTVRMYVGQLEVWATTDDTHAKPIMESIAVRQWVG